MIKINLAPIEEIRNHFWFIPYLLLFMFLVVFSWLFVKSYLSNIQRSIANIQQLIASNDSKIKMIKPKIKQYNQLSVLYDSIQTKIKALKNITVSKIHKYIPVIVLEHLQTIMPKAAWINSLSFKNNDTKDTLSISGGAFNSVIIANLIEDLRSTQNMPKDSEDIRNEVFFSKVELKKVTSLQYASSVQLTKNKQDKMTSAEKKIADANSMIKGIVLPSVNSSSHFPEISSFPVFNLNIEVSLRSYDVTSNLIKGSDDDKSTSLEKNKKDINADNK